jgi:hypothetical protein
VLRAADRISIEIKRRQFAQLIMLLNTFLAIVLAVLCWLKFAADIDVDWSAILSPLTFIGTCIVAADSLRVFRACWLAGLWLVARSDARARKSFTIRNR